MPSGVYVRTEECNRINSESQREAAAKLTPEERSIKYGYNKGNKSPLHGDKMRKFYKELEITDPDKFASLFIKNKDAEINAIKSKTRNETISKMTDEERKEKYGYWKGKESPNKKDKIPKICKGCGKHFEVIPALAKIECCSPQCAGKYRKEKGGYSNWNAMWIPELKAKAIRNAQLSNQGTPNVVEKILLKMISKFGFEYVGDGSFIINKVNPDFVIKDKQLAIELAGEHWHKKEYEINRPKKFEEIGWKCLVIWVKELKNSEVLCQKIQNWLTTKN